MGACVFCACVCCVRVRAAAHVVVLSAAQRAAHTLTHRHANARTQITTTNPHNTKTLEIKPFKYTARLHAEKLKSHLHRLSGRGYGKQVRVCCACCACAVLCGAVCAVLVLSNARPSPLCLALCPSALVCLAACAPASLFARARPAAFFSGARVLLPHHPTRQPLALSHTHTPQTRNNAPPQNSTSTCASRRAT